MHRSFRFFTLILICCPPFASSHSFIFSSSCSMALTASPAPVSPVHLRCRPATWAPCSRCACCPPCWWPLLHALWRCAWAGPLRPRWAHWDLSWCALWRPPLRRCVAAAPWGCRSSRHALGVLTLLLPPACDCLPACSGFAAPAGFLLPWAGMRAALCRGLHAPSWQATTRFLVA